MLRIFAFLLALIACTTVSHAASQTPTFATSGFLESVYFVDPTDSSRRVDIPLRDNSVDPNQQYDVNVCGFERVRFKGTLGAIPSDVRIDESNSQAYWKKKGLTYPASTTASETITPPSIDRDGSALRSGKDLQYTLPKRTTEIGFDISSFWNDEQVANNRVVFTLNCDQPKDAPTHETMGLLEEVYVVDPNDSSNRVDFNFDPDTNLYNPPGGLDTWSGLRFRAKLRAIPKTTAIDRTVAEMSWVNADGERITTSKQIVREYDIAEFQLQNTLPAGSLEITYRLRAYYENQQVYDETYDWWLIDECMTDPICVDMHPLPYGKYDVDDCVSAPSAESCEPDMKDLLPTSITWNGAAVSTSVSDDVFTYSIDQKHLPNKKTELRYVSPRIDGTAAISKRVITGTIYRQQPNRNVSTDIPGSVTHLANAGTGWYFQANGAAYSKVETKFKFFADDGTELKTYTYNVRVFETDFLPDRRPGLKYKVRLLDNKEFRLMCFDNSSPHHCSNDIRIERRRGTNWLYNRLHAGSFLHIGNHKFRVTEINARGGKIAYDWPSDLSLNSNLDGYFTIYADGFPAPTDDEEYTASPPAPTPKIIDTRSESGLPTDIYIEAQSTGAKFYPVQSYDSEQLTYTLDVTDFPDNENIHFKTSIPALTDDKTIISKSYLQEVWINTIESGEDRDGLWQHHYAPRERIPGEDAFQSVVTVPEQTTAGFKMSVTNHRYDTEHEQDVMSGQWIYWIRLFEKNYRPSEMQTDTLLQMQAPNGFRFDCYQTDDLICNTDIRKEDRLHVGSLLHIGDQTFIVKSLNERGGTIRGRWPDKYWHAGDIGVGPGEMDWHFTVYRDKLPAPEVGVEDRMAPQSRSASPSGQQDDPADDLERDFDEVKDQIRDQIDELASIAEEEIEEEQSQSDERVDRFRQAFKDFDQTGSMASLSYKDVNHTENVSFGSTSCPYTRSIQGIEEFTKDLRPYLAGLGLDDRKSDACDQFITHDRGTHGHANGSLSYMTGVASLDGRSMTHQQYDFNFQRSETGDQDVTGGFSWQQDRMLSDKLIVGYLGRVSIDHTDLVAGTGQTRQILGGSHLEYAVNDNFNVYSKGIYSSSSNQMALSYPTFSANSDFDLSMLIANVGSKYNAKFLGGDLKLDGRIGVRHLFTDTVVVSVHGYGTSIERDLNLSNFSSTTKQAKLNYNRPLYIGAPHTLSMGFTKRCSTGISCRDKIETGFNFRNLKDASRLDVKVANDNDNYALHVDWKLKF